MQEVSYFLRGERNYNSIRGDTGPLVYPAGFLYFFSLLSYLTHEGANVLAGLLLYRFISSRFFHRYFLRSNYILWYLYPRDIPNPAVISIGRENSTVGIVHDSMLEKNTLNIRFTDV